MTVATSDIRGAGTDSDVFITLFGSLGESGERSLESSVNDFERGRVDRYIFEGPDIGELKCVKVRIQETSSFVCMYYVRIDFVRFISICVCFANMPPLAGLVVLYGIEMG